MMFLISYLRRSVLLNPLVSYTPAFLFQLDYIDVRVEIFPLCLLL